MRIHRHRSRQPKYKTPQYQVNERIRAPEVRVVDDEGNALGVLETSKALEIAKSKEMDLVEVSPKADPPVCKILDYGHFKYQKEKEAKKQKAQSKEVELKGVRLSFRIGAHDFDVRVNQAIKFLDKGNKVKVELPLRGRERAHKNVAEALANRFLTKIGETHELRVEQALKYQGGRFTVIIAKS